MQYGYDENDNNNMSNETKRETNYSINNNNTRYMQLTKYNKHTNDDIYTNACVVHMIRWARTQRALVDVVSHLIGSRSESCHKHLHSHP